MSCGVATLYGGADPITSNIIMDILIIAGLYLLLVIWIGSGIGALIADKKERTK